MTPQASPSLSISPPAPLAPSGGDVDVWVEPSEPEAVAKEALDVDPSAVADDADEGKLKVVRVVSGGRETEPDLATSERCPRPSCTDRLSGQWSVPQGLRVSESSTCTDQHYESAEGAGDEHYESAESKVSMDSKGSCPLSRVAALSRKERCQMRLQQIKSIISLILGAYLVMFCMFRGMAGIAIAYIIVSIMYAAIRSLMDWVYDTAGFERTKKVRQLCIYVPLNLSQLRPVFDAQMCIRSGTVGMALNTTLMVEGLLKTVPLCLIDTMGLLILLSRPLDPISRMTAIYLPISVLSKSYGVTNQILTFELLTNGMASGAVKGRLRCYFFADVLVRGLSYGIATFAITHAANIYNGWAAMPFVVLYLNRVVLLFSTFSSRGFIYPPPEDKKTDGSSYSQQLLFSLFPAGFVQSFTDFPFNGDLATKARTFLLHQACSLGEAAAAVTFAMWPCDLPAQLGRAAWFFFGCWCLCWLLKAFTFQAYYHARCGPRADAEVATAATAKMRRSSVSQQESRIGALLQQHLALAGSVQFVVYVGNSCYECKAAVKALKTRNAEMEIRNVDHLQGQERLDMIEMLALAAPDGQPALPMIFCDGVMIGALASLEGVFNDGSSVIKAKNGSDGADSGQADALIEAFLEGFGDLTERVSEATDVVAAVAV